MNIRIKNNFAKYLSGGRETLYPYSYGWAWARRTGIDIMPFLTTREVLTSQQPLPNV